jgi:hypothetical protein
MTEKLTTCERYSSTLELACAEMKARLESLQQQQQQQWTPPPSADAVAYEREKEVETQKYMARHFFRREQSTPPPER